VTPITAAREPVSAPAQMPNATRLAEPLSALQEDVDQTLKQHENEHEPIVPASERAEMPSPLKPQVGDIGSLNDTLRQLLGRTRES
jgi:hypothetical protein